MNDKIIDQFIQSLKDKDRSTHTIVAYQKDITQFFEYVKHKGITKLDQIEPQTITDFIQSLFKQEFAAKTVSRKINALKTFFKFATMEANLTSKNPTLPISHPKLPTKGPRILDKVEFRALRDVVRPNHRLYAVIELMLQTGIRIGEVTRLRLADFKGSKLYIRPFESHPGREVPLAPSARAAIRRYLKTRPSTESDYLFVSRRGTPLSARNLRATIDRAFKKAGIKDARVSDIRHTFIAHQLMKGVPVVVVSKIVGHKRIETTSKYLDYLRTYKPSDYIIHQI